MPKNHLLEQTQKAKQLAEDYRIRALLVGPSKGGKTTSAIYGWPEEWKKLLVDMDNRAASIAGAPNTDVVRVRRTEEKMDGWNDILTLRDDLWKRVEGGSFPWKVVVYDGLSAMRKITMDYCLNLRGAEGKLLQRVASVVPTIAHVQPHMIETTKLVFNQLALPCHVIFTGHFYSYEDEHTKRIEYWPSLLGSSMRAEAGTWFDEVYHTWGEKTKEGMKYFWQTQPDRRLNFLGSTLNKHNKYWSDPVEIDLSRRPVGFEELLTKRFQKGGEQS